MRASSSTWSRSRVQAAASTRPAWGVQCAGRPQTSSSTCSRPCRSGNWVLTLPFELRGRLGFDGKLLGVVARIFTDSVLGWYRRRLRSSTLERTESGAVVVVQRASSDLKLNPHLHVVFLDGVYDPGKSPEGDTATLGGGLVFRALPHLSTTDVADVLQIARARILRHLESRGVIRVDDETLSVDDELAERDADSGEASDEGPEEQLRDMFHRVRAALVAWSESLDHLKNGRSGRSKADDPPMH